MPKEAADELVASKKEGSAYRIINGKVYGRSTSIRFTNLEHGRRHEPFRLVGRYTPDRYPHYDAINVDKTCDILMDWDGVMGVPITFLDKYCPEQFEILGIDLKDDAESLGIAPIGDAWVKKYKASGGTGHVTLNMRNLVLVENGTPRIAYKRILVRRKN